ncbi:CPBP family intramembrane glutamic endopeptidase [Aquimarina sediminis]|uniref:CPBP family intramembrane glutamic endopeptidase n=1 Tax=Aquimarina sediminis TaxID=2070536 RepID=UPI000CA06F30|nr:type II CAAX endopeptidase family protein [Aquimarina sediminis]
MTLFKSLIYTLLFIVFLELAAAWIFIFDVEQENIFTTELYHLINAIIELILVFSVLKITFGNITTSLETNIKYYFLAIIAGISYPFLQTPLNGFYNIIFDTSYKISYDYGMEGLLTWNSIAFIFIIPIAEELFFRGYLLRKLLIDYKPIIAIIFSTILFALIHLPYQVIFLNGIQFNGHHAYIAFFGGLISGIVYYRSKSIGPSIVFHCMWNLMVILI